MSERSASGRQRGTIRTGIGGVKHAARCEVCRRHETSLEWWTGVPRLPAGAVSLLREQDAIYAVLTDSSVPSGGFRITQRCDAVLEIDPNTLAVALDPTMVFEAGQLTGRCALLAVSSICRQYAIVHGTVTAMRASDTDASIRRRLGLCTPPDDGRLVGILDVTLFSASVCSRVESQTKTRIRRRVQRAEAPKQSR